MKDPRGWPVVREALALNRRFGEDHGGTMAAAMTYYTFLSLFPLILLALSVVGFALSGDPTAQADWTDRIAGSIPGLAPLIERNLRSLVNARAGTGVIGLVGLAWTGLGLVEASRETLGRVFRREVAGNVLRVKLGSVAAMFAIGLVGLAGMAAAAVPGELGGGNLVLGAVGVALGVLLDLGFFLLAYRALTPGPGPGFRELLPGAGLMTAGWTALKILGTWYALRVVARASAVYGTFGGVIGVLAILHIATRLFVYGAELSATLMEPRTRPAGA